MIYVDEDDDMMLISDYTTEDLVNELSIREGVERIDVDVMGMCDIVATNEDGEGIHDSLRSGPEIILRVSD